MKNTEQLLHELQEWFVIMESWRMLVHSSGDDAKPVDMVHFKRIFTEMENSFFALKKEIEEK